jgi:hypothetical protein
MPRSEHNYSAPVETVSEWMVTAVLGALYGCATVGAVTILYGAFRAIQWALA